MGTVKKMFISYEDGKEKYHKRLTELQLGLNTTIYDLEKQGISLRPILSYILTNNDALIPEPTARSAVPGVSPGRGLLIPHGYLHPGKKTA